MYKLESPRERLPWFNWRNYEKAPLICRSKGDSLDVVYGVLRLQILSPQEVLHLTPLGQEGMVLTTDAKHHTWTSETESWNQQRSRLRAESWNQQVFKPASMRSAAKAEKVQISSSKEMPEIGGNEVTSKHIQEGDAVRGWDVSSMRILNSVSQSNNRETIYKQPL